MPNIQNINMAPELMNFKKAIEYMDPMQITDCLQKTLDFFKRNNTELYFPSISPYVESFLVNLVSEPKNLKSELLQHENKRLAWEIIDILEMCRDVFRWTHSYENGNVLVYKKIFSNKMKKKSAKPSSIAHRLLQAQTSDTSHPTMQTTPNLHTCQLDPTSSNLPITSTGFKLRFLNKTLRFIKDDSINTLFYEEMLLSQAEYIYSLIKYRDKDVGFGYKSLYAPLWDAMEQYGEDYEFEMTIKETNSSGKAVLMLEKVPKNNKTKSEKTKPEITHNIFNEPHQQEVSKNTLTETEKDWNEKKESLNITTLAFPPLKLLSNITERFFKDTVIALTDFADDGQRASVSFHDLADHEVAFVKKVKTLAESTKIREIFSPEYRDLLWRLNYSIKEVLKTCKITTAQEKARSITLRKVPRFAPSPPVTEAIEAPQRAATGARSISVVSTNTRDRSISKERLIQFQKGDKLPGSGTLAPSVGEVRVSRDVEPSTDGPQERARTTEGLCKRKAKLLEDLSTPVESDKGIRMMLLMGWNGGALGARGDGIMEPVMPAIELPTRGGLGHVPPPKPPPPVKVRSRIPIDFRMTFMHCLRDLLLHDDSRKEIQLMDPLVKKEKSFIQSALRSLNARRKLVLTEREEGLVAGVAAEFANTPGMEVCPEYSKDLRIVTLHKRLNQPVKVPKMSAPRPKPAKSQVITITDDDIDVLITSEDVARLMPLVDPTHTEPLLHPRTVRRRAVRLLMLRTFADVLQWDQNRIIFKSQVVLRKQLKTFLRTVIEYLNKRSWHFALFDWEVQVYDELMNLVRGAGLTLTLEHFLGSKFVLTKTSVIDENKVLDNNNDHNTDNQNQVNMNDFTDLTNHENKTKKRIYVVVENKVDNDNPRLIQAIEQTTSNIKEAISNIVANIKDPLIQSEDLDGTDIAGLNTAEKKTDQNMNNSKIEKDNLKDIKIEANDSNDSMENEKIEDAKGKMETDCDAENNVEESHMTSGDTDFEAKIKVRNIAELSNWDRDIHDLEMTILKADLDCIVKEEMDNDICSSDLETTMSETDSIFKKGNDFDSYLSTKRSHSNSVCSQELDSKKVKISPESDENVLIIKPHNREKEITENIIRRFQTLMVDEIEKTDVFLPLLKCHGVQNGSLIYSCHDEDDITWLKKITSSVDLDIEIVPSALCLKNNRQLLIKINSYIPLDTKKLLHKFEIYNLGLDTKYWEVSYKHTSDTFIILIVTVDEKSFKYISDENFSLYCGIDKAQLSVIF